MSAQEDLARPRFSWRLTTVLGEEFPFMRMVPSETRLMAGLSLIAACWRHPEWMAGVMMMLRADMPEGAFVGMAEAADAIVAAAFLDARDGGGA